MRRDKPNRMAGGRYGRIVSLLLTAAMATVAVPVVSMADVLPFGSRSRYSDDPPVPKPLTEDERISEQTEFRALIGGAVLFEADKSGLGKGAKASLDKAIAWLKSRPDRKATLEGHSDDPGSDEYNLALGEKRANVVQAYMVAGGIPASRLSITTRGRMRPLSKAGGAGNCRVEILLK